jgi:hypothetical protein
MNNIIFNNVQDLYGRRDLRRGRRPRQYRHRPSPLLDVFTNEEIRARYRFTRESIYFICDLLHDDLVRPTNRNHALSVETQVLAGLRYLASGSFQQVVGDVLGIDKSSVSRCVTQFCESLVNKRHLFIKFPRTRVEKDRLKHKFFNVGGFPSTIAVIDGFQVPIIAPSENENDYVNRKGWHSINVQGMTDADNVFVNIVAIMTRLFFEHHTYTLTWNKIIC